MKHPPPDPNARPTRHGGPSTRALLSLAAVALLASCGRHGEPAVASPDLPAVKVHIAIAHLTHAPLLTETTGIIRPVQRTSLSAKIMGPIELFPVTLGQSVRTGETVARIGAGEISARVRQAQSQLDLAHRDLERERDLLAKGASTVDMVKGLEDRCALTQAMVAEAEAMLGYATLRAPFDGVVARKFANAGDLATPGLPLLEIEGTTAFEVDAALPDSLANSLTMGATISVVVPGTDISFSGVLTELSSAADPATHTVAARIAVPPGLPVRSGQFVRIQLPGTAVATMLIPVSAVAKMGQIERVFVAGPDDSPALPTAVAPSAPAGGTTARVASRAVLRLVRTGAIHGDRVELLTGVDDGERIVVDVPAGLREGQRLDIQP